MFVILGPLHFHLNFLNGLWISTLKAITLYFSCQLPLSSSVITTSNLLLLTSSLLFYLASYFTEETKAIRGEFSRLCATKYTDSPFPDPSLHMSRAHPPSWAQTPSLSRNSPISHHSPLSPTSISQLDPYQQCLNLPQPSINTQSFNINSSK